MSIDRIHRHPPLRAAETGPGGAPASPGGDPIGAAGDAAIPPAVGPAVLDEQALARLRELDPTGQARLLERVLDAYLNASGSLSAQLDQAVAQRDATVARRVAHTLKSSSASVGAAELAAACARAEALARDAAWGDELDRALVRLRQEWRSALIALGHLRDSL